MHSRLHRQFVRGIALATCLATLGGCVQSTRHSNTMVFGTNTTVGFKVGQNVNQVPKIMLAYDRQEAVIMPLLANTGDQPGGGNLLSPCVPGADSNTTTTTGTGSDQVQTTASTTFRGGVEDANGREVSIHPCSFVGYRVQGNNVYVQDSYSVLASFGASFAGNSGTGAEASAGIAQYFATGIAAQLLAAEGGAALVATGSAARESAESSGGAGIAAAITGSPAFNNPDTERSVQTAETIENQIADRIRATSQANLAARLSAFETAVGIAAGASAQCGPRAPAAIAELVDGRDLYSAPENDLTGKAAQVAAALAAWQTP